MGIISYNKKRLISLLRYLDTKPTFSRLFYWIYEIRKDELKTDKFMAVKMDGGYLLGCYEYRKHRTWKKFVESPFESDEVAIVKKLMPYFDCFIDIGAHIGYYSCLMNKMRPDMNIIAFEPSRDNVRSLEKNLRINDAKKTVIHPVGLGIKKETLTLYGNDAGGSIVRGTYNEIPIEKITVNIDRLDNYTNEIPTNASVFIKIDVEGNEYFALEGADQFIKRVRPIGFIIEIIKYWSGGENPRFLETFALMDKYGYDGYEITDTASLEKIKDRNKITGASYIFLRKDLSKKLERI